MSPVHILRILHLEDDPLDAELIRHELQSARLPCDIRQVDAREKFISQLMSNPFDLVLSDNRVPDIDGVEALSIVRRTHGELPFIFVSGWQFNEETERELKVLGATDVIPKSDLQRLTGWLTGALADGTLAPARAIETSDAPRQEILIHAIKALARMRSATDVYTLVTDAARRLVGADRGAFILRQPEADVYICESGDVPPLCKGEYVPLETSISGRAMSEARLISVDDLDADPNLPHRLHHAARVASLTAVPVIGGDTIGAIECHWSTRHHVDTAELVLLETLAATAASFLQSIHTYHELRAQIATQKGDLNVQRDNLERYAAALSHDLTAPVRHIEGFANMLRFESESVLNERAQHYLHRIESAAQRMGQMIRAVVTLLRFERMPVRVETVDLSTLARYAVQQLRKANAARNVDFIAGENITAQGDARQLKWVIDELLLNAWKFTSKREKAVIEFGTAAHDDARVYFVRDNGAGFSMAYAAQMFALFARMHTEIDCPGIGAGLATVHSIISKHRGKIWVDADVERGACFYFTLGNLVNDTQSIDA